MLSCWLVNLDWGEVGRERAIADVRWEQVDELELPKIKATELLRAHDGDAVLAMKAYLQPGF